MLYVDPNAPDMHELNQTAETPLRDLPYEKLCPGSQALAELMNEYR